MFGAGISAFVDSQLECKVATGQDGASKQGGERTNMNVLELLRLAGVTVI